VTPDPPGTARTAWAATLTDEHTFTSHDRDGAIELAYEDLSERWEMGDASAGPCTLTVYEDVLWCVGSEGVEDCHCGGGHEDQDGAWLMLSWGTKSRFPAELAEAVDADGEPADPIISHMEDAL